jgi:hypothetical protein
MAESETFTLTVNGQRYERWDEISVTHEIDRNRCESHTL